MCIEGFFGQKEMTRGRAHLLANVYVCVKLSKVGKMGYFVNFAQIGERCRARLKVTTNKRPPKIFSFK